MPRWDTPTGTKAKRRVRLGFNPMALAPHGEALPGAQGPTAPAHLAAGINSPFLFVFLHVAALCCALLRQPHCRLVRSDAPPLACLCPPSASSPVCSAWAGLGLPPECLARGSLGPLLACCTLFPGFPWLPRIRCCSAQEGEGGAKATEGWGGTSQHCPSLASSVKEEMAS